MVVLRVTITTSGVSRRAGLDPGDGIDPGNGIDTDADDCTGAEEDDLFVFQSQNDFILFISDAPVSEYGEDATLELLP